MVTYRVDVRPILEEVGGSVIVEDVLALPELVVGDESFRLTEPASFSATITNAGGGIVAGGVVAAPVIATCARCLCEFSTEISGEIEGFYVTSAEEQGDEDDTEIVDENGAIDLSRALIAALVVEAPFAPLHDEACAGLCVECGVDLNTEDCGCADAPADDHPFAALTHVELPGAADQ
jgi:uncharacterized protein